MDEVERGAKCIQKFWFRETAHFQLGWWDVGINERDFIECVGWRPDVCVCVQIYILKLSSGHEFTKLKHNNMKIWRTNKKLQISSFSFEFSV